MSEDPIKSLNVRILSDDEIEDVINSGPYLVLESEDLHQLKFLLRDEINQLKDIIQKQNSELDSLRKQVQDHHHLFVLLKARSVQCLSAFTKYKDVYMVKDPKATIRLDDIIRELNSLLPTYMKPMDRIELLDATRQLNEAQKLGLFWKRYNNDYVCEGWTIRKQSISQKPTLHQINNNPPITPMNSPARDSMTIHHLHQL